MKWLIWSNQHSMWWRSEERGYTQVIEEAGRYERAEAERIVAHATVDGQLQHHREDPLTGVEYVSLDEVMVPAPVYPAGDPIYLVWSNEARAWWGPNGSGYRHDLWTAGRYDEENARKACGLRTWSLGKPPPEVMVLAPESGQDSFTAEELADMPERMRALIDAATTAAMLARSDARMRGESRD